MDFQQRLSRAIERGQQTRAAEQRARVEQAMSEEDYRNLHGGYRLEVTEQIENCLRGLVDHFPGFDFETIVSSDGWGAKITRDELRGRPLSRFYSRLELVIRPFTPTHILELVVRGTIHNKEVMNRSHFQYLDQFDRTTFRELVDRSVLEYAEKYASAA